MEIFKSLASIENQTSTVESSDEFEITLSEANAKSQSILPSVNKLKFPKINKLKMYTIIG
jgi:hypothetical protein